MNEELALAIEELRLRPTNRTWFVPVKLNECLIPERSIGAGERLSDIQWVDLFEDWDAGIQLLLSTLIPNRVKYKHLYEAALEAVLPRLEGERKASPKTEQFTIGLVGYTGVGKSSILTRLIGPEREETFGRPGVTYDDVVRYTYWPGVALFADVPALGYGFETKVMAAKVLDDTADFVLYVISASSRIHQGDVNGVRPILDSGIPCIIILNKMDMMASDQETQILSYVTEQTGCPVVPVSAETGTNIDLLRALILKVSRLYAPV